MILRIDRDGMIDDVIMLVTSLILTSHYVFYEKILIDSVQYMIFKSKIFTIFSATFAFTSWEQKLKVLKNPSEAR